jgi:hypothetical protein
LKHSVKESWKGEATEDTTKKEVFDLDSINVPVESQMFPEETSVLEEIKKLEDAN